MQRRFATRYQNSESSEHFDADPVIHCVHSRHPSDQRNPSLGVSVGAG